MEDNNVKFVGTISHLSTEKNKFEGSGRLSSWPGSNSPLAVAITFSLTITFSFAISLGVLKLFGIDINLMCGPPGMIGNASTTQAGIVTAAEPLSIQLRALGIDGYVVVIKEINQYNLATELEYLLRQKRVHAKHLVYNSKYYVYVGPLYGKQRATAALNTVHRLGFEQAYILYPE